MLRLLKFCTVGGIGVGLNMGLLYSFTSMIGLYYMLSAVFAGIISVIYNFLANNYWTFRDGRSRNMLAGWGRFVVVAGVYYLIYYSLLYVLTSVAGIYYLLSALIAVAFGVVVKYVLAYTWVWKSGKIGTLVREFAVLCRK